MFTQDQITCYIDYFSDDKRLFFSWSHTEKQEDGVFRLGYPSYDQGFHQFVDDFYKSNLIDPDYLDHLDNGCLNGLTPVDLIELADLQLLKSILTYYIRSERFCDGAWTEAIENKIFLKVLTRLEELLN
jgi:hypothetical protein